MPEVVPPAPNEISALMVPASDFISRDVVSVPDFMSVLMPGFIAGLDFNQIRWNHRLYYPQTTISAPRQNPTRIDPVTTWDTVPKRRGCFSWRSADTAGLRQLGKTCKLQLLGRFNRTCAAGLRHSVRPANCKRGPLTGFEVPNVGHPFPFFFFFLFLHLSFQNYTSRCAAGGLFQAPRAVCSCFPVLLTFNFSIFGLYFKASQPIASPPAGPFVFLFC